MHNFPSAPVHVFCIIFPFHSAVLMVVCVCNANTRSHTDRVESSVVPSYGGAIDKFYLLSNQAYQMHMLNCARKYANKTRAHVSVPLCADVRSVVAPRAYDELMKTSLFHSVEVPCHLAVVFCSRTHTHRTLSSKAPPTFHPMLKMCGKRFNIYTHACHCECASVCIMCHITRDDEIQSG